MQTSIKMAFTRVILGAFLLYVTVVVSEITEDGGSTTEESTATTHPPCTKNDLWGTCWKDIVTACGDKAEWDKKIADFFLECSSEENDESRKLNDTLHSIRPNMCNTTVVNALKGNETCFNLTTDVLIALSKLNTKMEVKECTDIFNGKFNPLKADCTDENNDSLVKYLQHLFDDIKCDPNAASTIVIAPVLFFVTALLNIYRFF